MSLEEKSFAHTLSCFSSVQSVPSQVQLQVTDMRARELVYQTRSINVQQEVIFCIHVCFLFFGGEWPEQ